MVLRKRSIRLSGHNTSISLEPEFWDELNSLASQNGVSVAKLIESIDVSRDGNLSSSLRLYVLKRLKERS